MDATLYVVNVQAAVERDGGYLLVERAAAEEHAAGLLAFPAGTVESPPDTVDAVAATAVREVGEEVGIEVGDVTYVLSKTFEADDGTLCLNVATTCGHVDGEADPRAPDEVAAVHWLPADEVRAHPDVPEYTREYLDRIEAHREVA